MKNTYFPKHEENRMKNEGDVNSARQYFMTGKNRILYHLIEQRVLWMNEYIKDTDKTIIELGCGAGLSKQFIHNKNLILTDIAEHAWVDQYMDALDIDCPDESVDVFICSHMIHHIANPASFFDNVGKKLKPQGRIIIQDIYTSFLMKVVLRIMRHEGWSDQVNVYDRNTVCNNPNDAWSANCSIPKLMFWGGGFNDEFPMYEILKMSRNECLIFLTSGGVIAKTWHIPFGERGVRVIKKIDKILTECLPSIFACGCSIVLQRK